MCWTIVVLTFPFAHTVVSGEVSTVKLFSVMHVRHTAGAREHIMPPKCIVCKSKVPSFGTADFPRPRFCCACKPEDAFYTKSRRCRCGKAVATFGTPDNRVARYCGSCKPDDGIDVRHGRCLCGKARPTISEERTGRAKYCAQCRPAGSVNVSHRQTYTTPANE